MGVHWSDPVSYLNLLTARRKPPVADGQTSRRTRSSLGQSPLAAAAAAQGRAGRTVLGSRAGHVARGAQSGSSPLPPSPPTPPPTPQPPPSSFAPGILECHQPGGASPGKTPSLLRPQTCDLKRGGGFGQGHSAVQGWKSKLPTPVLDTVPKFLLLTKDLLRNRTLRLDKIKSQALNLPDQILSLHSPFRSVTLLSHFPEESPEKPSFYKRSHS